jgi:uncharacterized membrane protein (UPF0127 family)
VRLRHEPADDEPRTIAGEVDVADSLPARARGLAFRRSIPEEYAIVFDFRRPTTRRIHTLFVPFALDVCWLVDGRVERVRTLPPWVGYGAARADRVIELPAGAAEAVRPGDRLSLVG